MTAWGSVELAVEAMHRGVGDFVLKPWNNRQLLEILRTQIEHGASRRRELQEKILAEVAKFTGGRFEDDATLVVVAVASEKSSG